MLTIMKTKQNLQVIEILHIFLDILGLCEGGGQAGGGLETSSKSKEEIIGHGVNAFNVIQ